MNARARLASASLALASTIGCREPTQLVLVFPTREADDGAKLVAIGP